MKTVRDILLELVYKELKAVKNSTWKKTRNSFINQALKGIDAHYKSKVPKKKEIRKEEKELGR